jgi:hypothetical protein
MEDEKLISYRTLSKIAFDIVKKAIIEDKEFNKREFCRTHELSYSTFTKFMMIDPDADIEGKRRVWKSFIPALLKALNVDVEHSHSVHYYKINKGMNILEEN